MSRMAKASAGSLVLLLLTQALTGDLLAAGLAVVALVTGTLGYTKKRATITGVLRRAIR